MTRAERWATRTRDAAAKQPRVRFEGVEAYAVYAGDIRIQTEGGSGVTVKAARIPALVKFLHENFVRRDK